MSITADLSGKEGNWHLAVTEHPGWLRSIFGAKPLTTLWHSEEGIIWRDANGYPAHRQSLNYDCEQIFNRKKYLQKRYGEALA